MAKFGSPKKTMAQRRAEDLKVAREGVGKVEGGYDPADIIIAKQTTDVSDKTSRELMKQAKKNIPTQTEKFNKRYKK